MSFGPQASPSDDILEEGANGRRSLLLGSRRQSSGTRGVIISIVSAVIVFGGLTLLITRSPGWPDIKKTFFDGSLMLESLYEILPKFARNVFIFIVAEVFVLVLALVLAIMRSLPGAAAAPLRWIAIAYIDIFRGIPMIVLVALLGFGMPALRLQGVPDSDLFWGIVALVLGYAAYVAEVYRAGIDSIHPSQSAAARSLGLSRTSTLRYVILPQAIRRVVPPLLNDFISLQKDSALLATLGYTEALRQAQLIQADTFNFTSLVAVAMCFLVITIPMTRYVDWLVARQHKRRRGGAAA